ARPCPAGSTLRRAQRAPRRGRQRASAAGRCSVARAGCAPPRRRAPPATSAPPLRPRGAPARPTSSKLLSEQPLERVESAAKPGVDGPPRQVEQLGDLAGRVVEEMTKDDHGPVLRREGREGAREQARVRIL